MQPHFLGETPLLSTLEGGRVRVDPTLLSLWELAAGRPLDAILAEHGITGATPHAIRAALACLAEAGLLRRQTVPGGEAGPAVHGPAAAPQPAAQSAASVSVVIVSYNSLEWLGPCLDSLDAQTHALLEVIVVDNASSDGSVEWLETHLPEITLEALATTLPLSQALNIGVGLSAGDYTLLLNPDVVLAPDAVAQMLAVAASEPDCAAVAAKLLFSWAPAFLNGLGNRVGAFSWGTDNGLGHLDLGQFDRWRQVPSACFAAALIPRWAWEAVGPIDEGFPLYYEDTEWSYRARLLGYRVLAAPRAVVYHAFGRRVHTGQDVDLTPAKLSNVVYGRLRFATRLLGWRRLVRFLAGYALEDELRFLSALLRLQPATLAALWRGWGRFWLDLPALFQERRTLQRRRKASDSHLFDSQASLPPPFINGGVPELTWDLILNHYLPLIRAGETRPLPEFETQSPETRLLIISNDPVDVKMAGPGMRYMEMALALSEDLDVTLAAPGESALELSGVRLAAYADNHPETLRRLVEAADVVLIPGQVLQKFPLLEQAAQRLVVDLYDPFLLENLHYYLREPMGYQVDLNNQSVQLTNRLARLGDYFLCGSERQRDLWMGVLAANGRVNPHTFAQDQDLRALIDVVGIGFPERPPRHQPLLRGVHPQIPEDARIVLWGGGIWDWLDPLTLVRSWPGVLEQHPQARLVFLGTRHPNPLVPPHQMAARTIELAEGIGEKDRTILFFEWLPYEERESLLVEADIGVTLHPPHIETRYAIRTRVLDYLWAHLPVVVSAGDVTSEWVAQHGLGRTVPAHDPEAVSRAIVDILAQPKEAWAPAFEPLREVFSWNETVVPLRRYCLQGTPAPDRSERSARLAGATTRSSWRSAVARARFILRSQGWRALFHRLWRYLQWRLARP